MEWIPVIISCGALVFAGIGAVAAWVQAKAAVAARNDAQAARVEAQNAQGGAQNAQVDAEAARDEAVALAREANTAFIRQAEAAELANQLTLESRDRSDQPWELTRAKSLYKITNVSSDQLLAVDVYDIEEELSFPNGDVWESIAPSEAVVFVWERSMASPMVTTVVVTWMLPGERERRTWRTTITP